MAEINPPYVLQNIGPYHTAETDRMMLSGLLAGVRTSTGSRLVGRGGISAVAGSAFLTTQTGTPSMSVLVGSGLAFVAGSEGSVQGVYTCVNDAAKTLTVGTAHGTLARIDSVIIRVLDTSYSGATDAWRLEIVQGTPASSPVPPTSLPPNSLLLYNITVGAAVTSITNGNISDKRTYVTAAGGIIRVENQAERDSLTNLVAIGQGVFRVDTGLLEFRYGSGWVNRSQQVLFSNQVNKPPLNITGAYVNFTNTDWPAITFIAPPSGKVRVTISVAIENRNTTTSTIWAVYSMAGAISVAPNEKNGLSTAGSRLYGDRSRVYTGLTPGASCTVTPQWNISSGSSATCVFQDGQLQVELLQ